jgi:hypothetical protein
MATNAATIPDAMPIVLTLPVLAISITIHATIPAAPAIKVLTKACVAAPSAASADPALNPNQPNHRIPAPNITNGTLCGAGRF